MATISIIGSGNMATTIGTRAAKHGHTIELMSRDVAKAQALADQIGNGATVGTYGARPAGDIVILAVLYAGAVDVVTQYGEALAGKILVDITNPFNADATGLVTTAGNSISQQIAVVAPEGTHVVKAFNTIFRGVLAEEKPLDALLAGDSVEARARVAEFLASLDLRPLDTGGLEMTHALEWAGLLLVGLASNGAGFDVALGADSVKLHRLRDTRSMRCRCDRRQAVLDPAADAFALAADVPGAGEDCGVDGEDQAGQ